MQVSGLSVIFGIPVLWHIISDGIERRWVASTSAGTSKRHDLDAGQLDPWLIVNDKMSFLIVIRWFPREIAFRLLQELASNVVSLKCLSRFSGFGLTDVWILGGSYTLSPTSETRCHPSRPANFKRTVPLCECMCVCVSSAPRNLLILG